MSCSSPPPPQANPRADAPSRWITNINEAAHPFPADAPWVFAGSTLSPVKQGVNTAPPYAADADGTVMGLASFGTELISFQHILSHEADAGDLVWIANHSAVPPNDTPVIVQLRAATTTK